MTTQRICSGFLLAALAAGPLNAAEPAKADSRTGSTITADGISVAWAKIHFQIASNCAPAA